MKKYHHGFISKQNRVENAVKERKQKLSFRSYQKSNRKFQKNGKKIQKYHSGFISSQNRLENDEKGRK